MRVVTAKFNFSDGRIASAEFCGNLVAGRKHCAVLAELAVHPGNDIRKRLALGRERLERVGSGLGSGTECEPGSCRCSRSAVVRSGVDVARGADLSVGSQTARGSGLDVVCHGADAAGARLARPVCVVSRLAPSAVSVDGAGSVGLCRGVHHGPR